MIATSATLNALRRTFNRAFQEGVKTAPSAWRKVATMFPSGSAQNIYGWLMKAPQLREWPKGAQRQARSIAEKAYALPNQKFESTVEVNAEDIEDDNLGMYRPLVEMLGQESEDHIDRETFGVLDSGYRTTCLDGKAFFATDHPRAAEVDGTGASAAESNLLRGDLEVEEPAGKSSTGAVTVKGGTDGKAVGGTFRLKCTKAGAKAAAKFQLAVDGGDYGSEEIAASAEYAIPNSGGVVAEFGAGNYAKDEVWTIKPEHGAWYLLYTRSALKPLIYQRRTVADIRAIMDPENDTVFAKDVYPYGVRARRAFGVGFWQMAVASTKELTGDNFREARQRMMEIAWDGGQRTGFRPGLLAVGPGLLGSAESVIKAQFGDNGKTNTLYNTVEVCDSTWLR